MASNCSLRRIFFGCISIFIEVQGPWSILLLLQSSCSLDYFFFVKNGPLKGQASSFPSCWINNSLTPLLLTPHTIQSSFRYGINEVLGLWYDLSWYCWLVFFWCVDANLVRYDVGMYCQNPGWQWVQSLNRMMLCLYLMFIGFQIILQFCRWM